MGSATGGLTLMRVILVCGWTFGLAQGFLPAPAEAQAPSRAERLAAMGQGLAAAGDTGSALSFYRRAIAADPRFAEAYEGLGRLYLQRGSQGDALEVIRVGARRLPRSEALQLLLAETLRDLGDLPQAAEIVRAFLEREPESVMGHKLRAELAQARGAWSEALSSYRALRDLAQGGTRVPAGTAETAARHVAALQLLVATDPAGSRCDSSVVREALCAH